MCKKLASFEIFGCIYITFVLIPSNQVEAFLIPKNFDHQCGRTEEEKILFRIERYAFAGQRV